MAVVLGYGPWSHLLGLFFLHRRACVCVPVAVCLESLSDGFFPASPRAALTVSPPSRAPALPLTPQPSQGSRALPSSLEKVSGTS